MVKELSSGVVEIRYRVQGWKSGVGITGICDGEIRQVAGFSSLANYPNPFNTETTISYFLPEAADVELTVHDLNGRIVNTLAYSN